jgi:glycosyltransferase involved in cell wall biosynthesis
MEKVLIITYYWPPSGGAGVQRWLKFTKYLPEFGFEPHVLIPENATYPQLDNSLEKDISPLVKVLKAPIWEPYEWYSKITGVDKRKAVQSSSLQNIKGGWKSKLALWVRSNFFIPDARMFWIKPASKVAIEYIKKHDIKLVITTGPPHTAHMVGLRVKQALPSVKWVADFRDPWTNIDYYSELSLTKWGDKRHHKMEKKVVTTADQIVCVGYTWGEELKAIGNSNMEVITNGYDEMDINIENVAIDTEISITHLGTLGGARNPKILWEVLAQLKQEYPEKYAQIKVRLIGHVDAAIFSSIEEYGIKAQTEHIAYVPHNEANQWLVKSNILMIIVNQSPNAKGILPGKIFEYLASGRPIICLGPHDGDLAKLLAPIKNAIVVNHNDKEKLFQFLLHYTTLPSSVGPEIKQYSRRALTEKLAFELTSLLNNG